MASLDVMQFVGSLALVCALIWGMALLAKKTKIASAFGRVKSASGALEVQDVLFLDPKHRVITLRWHDQHHLILLSTITAPQVIATRPVLTKEVI